MSPNVNIGVIGCWQHPSCVSLATHDYIAVTNFIYILFASKKFRILFLSPQITVIEQINELLSYYLVTKIKQDEIYKKKTIALETLRLSKFKTYFFLPYNN